MMPDTLYLDREQLTSRGWTDALIRKHLGAEDRRFPVDHWANFSGKCAWFLGRVEEAELTETFQRDFAKTVRRRRLPASKVKEFSVNRDATAGIVKEHVSSLPPKTSNNEDN